MDLLGLSSLEIRQICYFLMVVECDNSFSRAAQRLHIEQPPLSQRIRALEKKLKVELFDRRRRPVHLTPAGNVFWQEAQQALTQMQQAITQAQRAARGEIGHLTVGLASSAANGVFSDMLKRFRDRYPTTTVTIKELTAEQQLSAIETGQLDIGFEAISPLQLQSRPFSWQVIAKESLLGVLPKTHLLAAKKEIALTDLATESLILPNMQAFPFYQAFLEKCTEAGFQPHIVESTTATWMLTILSLVAADVGVAVLPSNVTNLQRTGVVYRAISGLNLPRELVAVWSCDRISATLQNWLDLLPNANVAER
ncbi:MAG: LysR substrate-binding domain-containing protein [Cyanobacteria bacterium J06597_16]